MSHAATTRLQVGRLARYSDGRTGIVEEVTRARVAIRLPAGSASTQIIAHPSSFQPIESVQPPGAANEEAKR